ncbi:MAG: hypothetical protein Q9218_007628, partial [Villophora microphyllina]
MRPVWHAREAALPSERVLFTVWVSPEDLNLDGFTHINFAFAFFDPSSYQIAPMDGNAVSLYSRFTGLKSKSPGLQTWVSVGGWSFTDPFSNLASSAGNRQTFISGLIKFMSTYGFDRVDLDWEYPAADDRGGVEADTNNYVLLAQEMKSAFGSKYGLSMTLPTSYWYLQHFDLMGIQDHVDWFNLMAYDLHGTWDAQSIFVGPYIAPHTNITEIDAGLDLVWRAGVTPAKVVMGEGYWLIFVGYGRSFALKDPSCNTPNGICQFIGGANAGACSNAVGILDYQEIQDIIKSNNVIPVHDEKAGVKWITWGGNQWVSYDDDDTFQQKRDFANSRCLGGLTVWAMDQKDQTGSNGLAPVGITKADQDDAKQMSLDQQASVTCYTSACGEKCKKGTSQSSQINGQPGQTSTTDRCPKGKYQNLCCDHAPSKSQLKKDAADAAKSAAKDSVENVGLDLAAKAFCRVAVPVALAPLEAGEALIPILGEGADIAEFIATPFIIKGCIKGLEKEGKAVFKVFGKKKTLSFGSPTDKPP